MRKKLILLTALFLALALISGCSGSDQKPAEPVGKEALDAVFAAGGTIRLVSVNLPGSASGLMPLDLSPDGETVLWRAGESMILTRGGKTIPVAFAPGKGAGDPYGKEQIITADLARLPSWEGFSWSDDGRYIALTDMDSSAKNSRSIDVPVIDTSSGELYLARTYSQKYTETGFGIVFLNRVDRKGEYLYYLTQEMENKSRRYRFCRCPVQGGDSEVLCDVSSGDDSPFDILPVSSLYEAADGSWIMTGLKGNYRNRSESRMAAIRFYSSGNGWKQEPFSLDIPYTSWTLGLNAWSAASGYGLMCLSSTGNGTFNDEDYAYWNKVAESISLVRIRPGDGFPHDVWFVRNTGENGEIELVSGDDLLQGIKIKSGTIAPDEEQAAAEWLEAKGGDPANCLPEGYDRDSFLRERLTNGGAATCAAISPDGYYALINAGGGGKYRLYMISLETMKALPVDAPEGIGGMSLTSSPLGQKYRPGIVWNEDGTLLIQYTGDSDDTAAFRLETVSAR